MCWHEARINKLLLKKAPGIMSANGTSIVCEQDANKPSKATREKEGEGDKYNTANM